MGRPNVTATPLMLRIQGFALVDHLNTVVEVNKLVRTFEAARGPNIRTQEMSTCDREEGMKCMYYV